MAILFDQVFGGMGIKKPKGVKRIVSDFIQKEGLKRQSVVAAETIPEDEMDEGGVDPEEDGSLSQAGHEFMTKLQEASEDFPTDEELQERAKTFSVKLVPAFVRRQEFRGSDVRLDVGALYRPDSFPRGSIDVSRWLWHTADAYRFEREERINILEMRALLRAFRWRLRSSAFTRTRALHLTDSQVVLATAVKGRSSARSLNRLLRRFCALQVAAGIYPILGWPESEMNPADAPSRRNVKKTH